MNHFTLFEPSRRYAPCLFSLFIYFKKRIINSEKLGLEKMKARGPDYLFHVFHHLMNIILLKGGSGEER